jgi:fimbrial chaperone protein
MSRTVTVQNTSSRPLPVELRVEGIAFDASGPNSTGKDPGDLVVYPAQAMIAPGQTQAFRIQYAGDPQLATSRHYYVTVAQLPVAQAGQVSSIQLLYNFRVMVSVQPLGAKPNLHVVSAQMETGPDNRRVPMIEVANDSAGYGYLSQGNLLIVEKDAAGREVARRTMSGPEIQQTLGYGLVGPGQTRKVALPGSANAKGASVDVRFTPQARRP